MCILLLSFKIYINCASVLYLNHVCVRETIRLFLVTRAISWDWQLRHSCLGQVTSYRAWHSLVLCAVVCAVYGVLWCVVWCEYAAVNRLWCLWYVLWCVSESCVLCAVVCECSSEFCVIWHVMVSVMCAMVWVLCGVMCRLSVVMSDMV